MRSNYGARADWKRDRKTWSETGVKTGTVSWEYLPVVPSSRGGGGGGGGGGKGGYLWHWHASWHCSLTFSATVREHDLWSSPLWCERETMKWLRSPPSLHLLTRVYHQHNAVQHKWRCLNTQEPLSEQHCGYPLSILFISQLQCCHLCIVHAE